MSSPGKALNLYPSNEYEVLPNGCEAHWEVVERILFIYAKLNPGIAYVQGMNEIVGPIYYTFATDPNAEWKGKQQQQRQTWLLLRAFCPSEVEGLERLLMLPPACTLHHYMLIPDLLALPLSPVVL